MKQKIVFRIADDFVNRKEVYMKFGFVLSIVLSLKSFGGSQYLTDPQFLNQDDDVIPHIITLAWMVNAIGNIHSLEIANTMDTLDSGYPKHFMMCDDPYMHQNKCPMNIMGGMFVVEMTDSGYEIADTFWGTQDDKTRPSPDEIKARTNELVDKLGYSTYVLSGSAKDIIQGDEFIQDLRIRTATAYYFKKTKNVNEIVQKVREAAKINHMDVDRYASKERILSNLAQLTN